jgi:hypothetical protein
LRVETRHSDSRDATIDWWNYLVIQLDRALPHMVLDAVQNDRKILGQRVSNLPARFDLAQRLSLEGDFDRYFTLYAPADYERDALYVFTPDLMALLIDEAGSGEGGSMDVEIIDDRMYVYAPGLRDFLQPFVWQRFAAIVQTVGAKTLRQTTNHADERVGDRTVNVVAEPGRRLKRRFPLVAAIVVGLLFLYVVVSEAWPGLLPF